MTDRSKKQRIVAASTFGVGVLWQAFTFILDNLGRIDIALKIKEHIPSWLSSPLTSVAIIVLGIALLWWTGRTPVVPVVLYDANDKQVETPRHQTVRYALVALAVACATASTLFIVLRRSPVRPTTPTALVPSPTEAHTVQPKKKHSVEFRPASALLTECNKGIPGKPPKTYSDYSRLPGGADEKRPWVVISTTPLNGGAGLLGNDTIFLFELTLVNRGEASIVKDWQICLLNGGKAQKYPAAEIPAGGLLVTMEGSTKTIVPSDSLPEKTISTAVAHANTAIGWVFFKVPGTDVYNEQKHKLPFAIMFKDYLDHQASFEGTWTGDTTPTKIMYVPGTK